MNLDYKCDMILPTDLAPILINGDFTGLDHDNDEHYEEAINQLLAELDSEGLQCVDVLDDDSFSKYHDMLEYGVLACNCSTFIFN